ncbi:MAG: SPOR domain-containing protein [Bacillota bacterium]
MHRFGRSAQKKMNDRWGGAFILAVLLAVAGAWKLGDWIGNSLGDGGTAAIEPVPGLENSIGSADGTTGVMQPHEFQIHFVQVGAFRSDGAARNLAKALSEAGYTAAVTPKSADGLSKVYAGPYMTETAAADAKARLMSEGLVQNSFNVSITVDYKPDAVMAMTGSPNSDLQKGLDALNTYLYEAGNWFANRSSGQSADGFSVAALAGEMTRYTSLSGNADTNPAVSRFLAMATLAGENAAAIEAAATAMPGSDEFQKAMNGYVSLLDQYHSFHSESGLN